MKFKTKLNKKGFTLIELLGVITILALLTVVVIPNVLKIVNDGKKKTYEILKNNMKVAAENYVNECSSSSQLYKVYIPSTNTTVNAIIAQHLSAYPLLTEEAICNINNILSCSGTTVISSGKQVLLPYKCKREDIVNEPNGLTLTALELAHNGFLKSIVDDNGNRTVIRSTDEVDVGNCLKVTIKYDNTKYKYSYIVKDTECN